MSCRTESRIIGEREFSVTQWPVEKSLLMKLKLIKAFGVSITKLVSVVSKEKINESEEIAAISDGLSSLFDSNSPEELLSLMKLSVVGVACEGKRITDTSFNEVFSTDELMDIYKVFVFVIQVNYKNFLKGQWADKLLASVKDEK